MRKVDNKFRDIDNRMKASKRDKGGLEENKKYLEEVKDPKGTKALLNSFRKDIS